MGIFGKVKRFLLVFQLLKPNTDKKVSIMLFNSETSGKENTQKASYLYPTKKEAT